MKNWFWCFIFCALVVNPAISFSQESQKSTTSPSVFQYKNISVQSEVEKNLEAVFPEVVFRYKFRKVAGSEGVGVLQAIYMNRIYAMPEKFNYLLYDLKMSSKNRVSNSDEDVIKAYTFLLLSSGPKPYLQENLKKITIQFSI